MLTGTQKLNLNALCPRISLTGVWRSGHTLVELVATIAVISLLASFVAEYAGGVPAVVKNSKLQSDVSALNSFAAIYLSDGGSFAGLSSPDEILDQMKKSRIAADMQEYTGPASGRLVDVRLRAKMGEGPLSNGVVGRAVWDANGKRFVVDSSGAAGVEEFFLDESLASTSFGTETRRAHAVKFNRSSGWIWGSVATTTMQAGASPTYVDPAGVQTFFNPDEPAGGGASSGTSSGTPPSSGGGNGSSSGSSSSGSLGVPAKLPAPVFTPSGGAFAYTSFPTVVSISANGAPDNASKLVYQLNNGMWQDYTGPVSVQSGDTVEAQNLSLSSIGYSNSDVVTEDYYRLVSSVTGGVLGTWADVSGGVGLVQSITTDGLTTTLSHGNTQLDLGGGQYLDAGVQNVISFTQSTFSSIAPNTSFTIGQFTMLNGATFYNSEATGASLQIELTLDDPSLVTSINVELAFISTENSMDQTESADIVKLMNPATQIVMSSGGVNYHLELSWVSLDPAGGLVQDSQLLVYEGSTAKALLNARMVPDK